MEYILLVEQNTTERDTLSDYLFNALNFSVETTDSLSTALNTLENENRFCIAVVLCGDVPELGDTSLIERLSTYKVPVVIYSEEEQNSYMDHMGTLSIAQHINSAEEESQGELSRTVSRLAHNIHTKIVVVDDDPFFRNMLSELLRIHQFQVFSAADGYEALKQLEEHHDTKLVIIDYTMPFINGCQLTKKIRETIPRDDLAIIGISADAEQNMFSQFIKNGANDFFVKQSFNVAEFYCRVNLAIENIDLIRDIKSAKKVDTLTGLYVWDYFQELANKLLNSMKRKHLTLTAASFVVDRYDEIEQQYGKEVALLASSHIAEILRNRFRSSDLLAKVDDSHFVALAINMDVTESRRIFAEIRTMVDQSPLVLRDGKTNIDLSVSIGVSSSKEHSLKELFNAPQLKQTLA